MTKTPEDPRRAEVARICLALPEATRRDSGDHSTFLVRKKVFAYYLSNHHGDGIIAVAVKTELGENEEMVRRDPVRFFRPAYIGPHGWVGLRLDVGKIDWSEVADLVTDSYRLQAPKRLAALAGGG